MIGSVSPFFTGAGIPLRNDETGMEESAAVESSAAPTEAAGTEPRGLGLRMCSGACAIRSPQDRGRITEGYPMVPILSFARVMCGSREALEVL